MYAVYAAIENIKNARIAFVLGNFDRNKNLFRLFFSLHKRIAFKRIKNRKNCTRKERSDTVTTTTPILNKMKNKKTNKQQNTYI